MSKPFADSEFDDVLTRRITGTQKSWRERIEEINEKALMSKEATGGRYWFGLDPKSDLTHGKLDRCPSPAMSGFDVRNLPARIT
jgi:hypothetical protein